MIVKPTVDQLLDKACNRYELVIAVSKRARQIVAGDNPKIETDETSEVSIASLELSNNKYRIVRNRKEMDDV